MVLGNISQKVLFVDDEAEIVSTFEEIFQEFDQRLIFALSSRDAIQMLKVHDVGLVIADYWMPRGKGIEILEYIEQNNLDTKFCFYTGRSKDEFESLSHLERIYHKPDDLKELLNRIRAFLTTGT